MSDDGQQLIRPNPDPSVLTTAQLLREIGNLREMLTIRIDAVDLAAKTANEHLVRVPTEVQKQVGGLKELVEEKIGALQLVTDTRLDGINRQADHRQRELEGVLLERLRVSHIELEDLKELLKEIISREVKGIGDQITGRDTALAAALKAAQDAVAQQNTANQLAIDKAQAATKEAQGASDLLFRSVTDTIRVEQDNHRTRLTAIEAGGVGASANTVERRAVRGEQHQSSSLTVMIIAAMTGIIAIALSLAALLHSLLP